MECGRTETEGFDWKNDRFPERTMLGMPQNSRPETFTEAMYMSILNELESRSEEVTVTQENTRTTNPALRMPSASCQVKIKV